MKAMLAEVKSGISEQDQGSIRKRIQELGELARRFISKAYALDQKQTISLLKEDRIGGHSIIGESSDKKLHLKHQMCIFLLDFQCTDNMLRFGKNAWSQRNRMSRSHNESC